MTLPEITRIAIHSNYVIFPIPQTAIDVNFSV